MTTLRQRHSTQGQYATLGKLNSLEHTYVTALAIFDDEFGISS